MIACSTLRHLHIQIYEIREFSFTLYLKLFYSVYTYFVFTLDISHHCYADSTQIYLLCNFKDLHSSFNFLNSTYNQITKWLSNNLKINHNKSEASINGTPSTVGKMKSIKYSITLEDSISTTSPHLKNLGVQID